MLLAFEPDDAGICRTNCGSGCPDKFPKVAWTISSNEFLKWKCTWRQEVQRFKELFWTAELVWKPWKPKVNWILVNTSINSEEKVWTKAIAEVVKVDSIQILVHGRLLLQPSTSFGSVMLKSHTFNKLHPSIVGTSLIVTQHTPDELGPGHPRNV